MIRNGDELRVEAQKRLGSLTTIQVTELSNSYLVSAEKARCQASGKLRKDFWRQYLSSGKTDNCQCVDHFFEHLQSQLDGDSIDERPDSKDTPPLP